MSAKIHPHLMIHSAVILLYLIKSLKSATEEEKLPTNTPIPTLSSFLEPYKTKILYSINVVRKYHKLPKICKDAAMSISADIIARDILERKTGYRTYIPGEMEENPPVGYFPLVNRMQVPNITEYAGNHKRYYNPILLWWATEINYPGHYDKNLHPKYGFFTQLIWKDSKRVGTGLAYKKLNNGSYEIVLYLPFVPRGNNPDTWNENVHTIPNYG